MIHSESARRRVLFERDGYRCRFCGGAGEERDLDLARLGPLGGGGVDGPDALVTSCRPCAARLVHLAGEVAWRERELWTPPDANRRTTARPSRRD